MRLTRVYRFSASHRLHSSVLSNEENLELYGKCNNPYGHGHNYILHITVSGNIDENTGRVVAPGELDRFVHERVIEVFDHRDMNMDVHDFQGVPTTENLALEIARRLCAGWNQILETAKLDRVFVQETGRNSFELKINGN
jgi:6-pyruvoyltetrahydropterin/6-carboxytetrahydropterin synthase